MRLIETDLGDNLAPLCDYLWSAGIPHRVFEERGRQVLELERVDQMEQARAICGAWRDGRLGRGPVPRNEAKLVPRGRGLRQLAGYPVLTALILLALALFPFSHALGEGDMNAVVSALLMVDPATYPSGATGVAWQPWRWLSPILLHFSITHLAFNVVVLIELGRRIEPGCGSTSFLLLIMMIGIGSNFAQLYWGGSALFGGLSGVGYGLLGFLLVMARLQPAQPLWRLPAGFALSLLLFLVLFSTGITEHFGLQIANAAHWGGLVAGGLLALLFSSRGSSSRVAPGD